MSIENISDFSAKARSDNDLGVQLKECTKMKELFSLAKDHGFDFIEDDLYPPNEPQFTADQLSERLAKALLRG